MPRWPLLLSPPAVSTSPSRSRLPRRPSPSLSPPVSSSAVATGVFVARCHCGGARWQHGGGGGCRGHAHLHRAAEYTESRRHCAGSAAAVPRCRRRPPPSLSPLRRIPSPVSIAVAVAVAIVVVAVAPSSSSSLSSPVDRRHRCRFLSHRCPSRRHRRHRRRHRRRRAARRCRCAARRRHHSVRRRRSPATLFVVAIALAATALFVAHHPNRRRHRKADCCIVVVVVSRIDVVVVIASPPSRTYRPLRRRRCRVLP